MTAPVIHWFRDDLRLADNAALTAAARQGPVVPVFIFDRSEGRRYPPGGASKWWLHHSLASLASSLAKRGLTLIFRSGEPGEILQELAEESCAARVTWQRAYDPYAISRDTRIKVDLNAKGIAAESFPGALLAEPFAVKTQAGGPFSVYSPFRRALDALGPPGTSLPIPEELRGPATLPASERLEDWALLPRTPDWAGGLRDTWTPGEEGAQRRLSAFLATARQGYRRDRDRPDLNATSRLSPHLHFGEISPRMVAHAARMAGDDADTEKFLAELAWREFSHHLLFHFPELPERNWRKEFDRFPWAENEAAFRAWSRGLTGYPIVDAGMRELWTTGYMHNRVRMITASFLTKHLLIDWRRGADWFFDTLVDADLANNSASWQWVAGSGADAAPYFRIFNPVLQGEKFDPYGAYVRRHVPEIAQLPDNVIHRPWEADEETLIRAGVVLGKSYPRPLIDHKRARARALAAYDRLRGGDSGAT